MNDQKIQLWLQQKRLKFLQDMQGNGTSLISLIIPPKGKLSKIMQMLQKEYGTASHIKDRVNRLSVLSAITSTKEKLKLFHQVPQNGLALYCGNVVLENGKQKKVHFDIEPFRPLHRSLYRCDHKFHVEALLALLQVDEKFGFVIIDGNGCLFGILYGNNRTILHHFSVNLPKKHGKGGQSAQRYGRIRMGMRQAYIKKVTELIVKLFIKEDSVIVKGFIFAGSAQFKNQLVDADSLDPRIKRKLIQVVDISYGGEHGFHQAISLSMDNLGNLRYVEEKRLLQSFFERIANQIDKVVFGMKDTLQAMEMGAVETCLIWEGINVVRVCTQDEKIVFWTQSKMDAKHHDEDILDQTDLIEWLIENHTQFGTQLEIVSNNTSEGAQFSKGFGGIGGLLRYSVHDMNYDEWDDDDVDSIQDDSIEDEFQEYDDFM